MRRRWMFVGGWLTVALAANAQEPRPMPPLRPADQPRTTVTPPATPPTTKVAPPPVTPPPPDNIQNAPNTQFPDSPDQQAPVLSSAPRMIGDFPGYFATGCVTVRSFLSGTVPEMVITIPPVIPSEPTGLPPQQGMTVVIPARRLDNYAEVVEQYCYQALALSRGGFKIAENESVRPQDRVYVSYHYFHQIPQPIFASSAQLFFPPNSPFSTQFGSGPFPVRDTLAATVDPNVVGRATTLTDPSLSAVNVHRETIGFEKTFLDGTASIGVRLPFLQTDGTASASYDSARLNNFAPFPSSGDVTGFGNTLSRGRVGDISVVLKYAPVLDPDGSRVVATGMVVTAPTGGGILLPDGSKMYSTLLQPYVGFLRTYDQMFVHGFSSLAVPTDDRDAVLFFNDVGIGYTIYSNPTAMLTWVAPTIEGHLTTPVHRNSSDVFLTDVFTMTGGIHFGVGPRSTLTVGVATPVTGPRPYEVEAFAQFNWTF